MELMTDVQDAQPMSEGGTKRRAVAGGGRDGTKEVNQANQMMLTMGKLLLSTTLRTRVMMSILLQVVRIESGSQYVVAMKEATQSFASTMKSLRQKLSPDQCRDKIGLPCVHAFNALVTIFVKDMRTMEGKQQMVTELEAAVKRWNDESLRLQMKPWEYLHRYVKVCRHENMWDKKYRKLVVNCPSMELENSQTADYSAVTPVQMWYLIKQRILQMPNSKELPGIAPPGDLERQIQEYIDRHQSTD